MASNGKLQARITVPTGGWAFAITEVPANTATITVPAGTYYHSTADSEAEGLLDTIQTLIDFEVFSGNLDGTYTVTLANGENGTGKYTISATGITSFSIAWTSSVLQALLGFTSTPTGALTYTGENHCQGLWLPSYGHQKKNGGVGGGWVTDQQTTKNSAGYVYSVMGQKHRQTAIRWPMESRQKCWVENETTGKYNESFEAFLIDGIWGEAAWGTSAGPIRFHPDAGANDAYGTFSVLGMESWSPSEMQEHWTGRWMVELPQLVEVPESNLGARAPVSDDTPEVIPQTLDGIANASDPLQAFADACGMDFKMDYLWIGNELVGATELGGSGLDLVNTSVDQGQADARLGDGDTCLFDSDADGLAVSSALLNVGAGAMAILRVHAMESSVGNRQMVSKFASNRGYILSTGSGTKWFDIRTASGSFRAEVAIDHGTLLPQVDLALRNETDALNSLITREGTGSIAETDASGRNADNAAPLAVGSDGALPAARMSWGLEAFKIGADAELVTATHRSNLQTWLGFD